MWGCGRWCGTACMIQLGYSVAQGIVVYLPTFVLGVRRQCVQSPTIVLVALETPSLTYSYPKC